MHLFKLPEGEPKYFRVMKKYKVDGKTSYRLNYNEELFETAACKGVDTELFFPNMEIYSPSEVLYFNRMCADCPVKAACLEWALAHERHGVWAGTTPAIRQQMRNEIGWVMHDPATYPDI
jgi:WhiB family redox-sensing transcriptional regulator